jgi:hypothetical protein
MHEDNDWAKYLSKAVFQSGKWQLENDFDVRRRFQIKIKAAVDRLYEAAKEAQHLFNENLSTEAQGIQLLRISGPNHDSHGLLLLLGKSQLKVERCQGGIQKTLLKRSGYETQVVDISKYMARDDGLSCILWISDSNELKSEAALIKDFFIDLVKCERSLK